MSWENALLMEFSNDVEKYEIEVTQKQPTFFTVHGWCIYSGMNKCDVLQNSD